jgi:hypothetical protein
MSFALTFALAFAHGLAAFAAFPSTFVVSAFAFAADDFAFTRGAKLRVFVLAIFNAVGMSYVHVYAVLIGARQSWRTVNAVLRHATLVEDSGEFS